MGKSSEDKMIFKRIILIILSCIFICSIISIIIIQYKQYVDAKKQEEISKTLDTIEITEKIEEPKTERMLQVEKLQEENTDVIGWLEIEETNINYPVLQGEDNDYYLTHNYKKEKVSGGSIFLDKDYDFSLPSSNLLIYGHRHQNGLMFENLVKYKEENFYKEHSKIRFTTTKEDAEYEIIAVFKSRKYLKKETNVFRYYFFINAKNEEEYNDYINNCKKASLYDTGKTATYGEQLLTLSTCEYSQKEGRFVVVAKKIK